MLPIQLNPINMISRHLALALFRHGQPNNLLADVTRMPAPRPGQVPPLAARGPPAHEPDDDEDGHRDQPDNDKHLERCEDPARDRDGKPDGEDRAEDCPDDPAHVPSMRPEPRCARVVGHGTGETPLKVILLFPGDPGSPGLC